MTTELIAILDGQETGRVVRDKRARLTFTYDEEWRTTENAYSISISMPLALAEHGHARIDPVPLGVASRQPDGARSMGQ
jgi:serine/threonine-protein kinase HipA